jgi:hypothetical protein
LAIAQYGIGILREPTIGLMQFETGRIANRALLALVPRLVPWLVPLHQNALWTER